MPIRKTSDTQYVEQVRRLERWRFWLGAPMMMFGLAAFIGCSGLFANLSSDFSDTMDEQEETIQQTIEDSGESQDTTVYTPEIIHARESIQWLFGWMAGSASAGGLGIAISGGITMWGNRRNKLLLAYHDLLKEAGALDDDDRPARTTPTPNRSIIETHP